MENQLHVGHKLCINQMVLSCLYEYLGEGVETLKKIQLGPNLLLAGPYWLLQLWLNATFETSLSSHNIINKEDDDIKNRRFEGTHLVQLTPNDEWLNLHKKFTGTDPRKVINVDPEPTAKNPERIESDNSSPGVDALKDGTDGTEQSSIKHVIPGNSNTHLHHPLSNKDSNKGSTSEVNKPADKQQEVSPPKNTTQHSQTTGSDSEDGEEKEHHLIDIPETIDIQNPKENVQDKTDDSLPKILNQGEDVLDKEEDEDEDEDHSMFDIPIDPLEEEEDGNANPSDVPTNNQNLGSAKAFKTPSTSTIVAFSLEELETLNKNKPTEYLKAIMSTRGSSTDKFSSSSTVFWWSVYK
ncbi:uncharacterized protein LOC127079478 [Lathyrus oleraceus]|uniref:uncharacterized protein LOC127079478 n=1 Tax=Pisum sativum TaxID=3888 RepID=UPI0021D0F179|nr:uncharacterized protein LOC127079478 [Pisum sativum]